MKCFRFLFYFTTVSVKCRVAAVKYLPVLHHSANYIFISFATIEPILITLKIEYRLKPVLRGVCSIANYIAVYEYFRSFVCSSFPKATFYIFISLP